jgi:hypothetical protein
METKSLQDVIEPFSEADMDALFIPTEKFDSEAVNVGRSYYGDEWGKGKKK